MNTRFDASHVDAWRRDGGVLIERFFTAAEVAAVQADFERVFGRAELYLYHIAEEVEARGMPAEIALLPKVGLGTIFRGCWPFVVIMIGVLGLLIAFPQLSLWLPSLMK